MRKKNNRKTHYKDSFVPQHGLEGRVKSNEIHPFTVSQHWTVYAVPGLLANLHTFTQAIHTVLTYTFWEKKQISFTVHQLNLGDKTWEI